MKHFAPTLPAHLYPEVDRGSYHLLQAHTLVGNDDVLDWVMEASLPRSGHHIILDNGLIELGHADVDSLMLVADQVHPHEVICPDAAFDMEQTCALFREHALDCAGRAEQVMAVPQGESLAEWCDCAERLAAYAAEMGVGIVYGVSKLINTFKLGYGISQTPRMYALLWLDEFMREHNFWHQVHLLGIHDDIIAAAAETFLPCVRGIDSTLPYAAALAGRLVGPMTPKFELSKADWEGQPAAKTLRITEINIAYCRWRINRG